MVSRGITLLELLAVLIVVGVLAAFAVPAYQRQLVRVHRAEAAMALYQLVAEQERFYLRQGVYARNLTEAPPTGLGLRSYSSSNRYALSISAATDAQTFIATATPTRVGGQSADAECLAFSIDQNGRRAVSGSRGAAFCWR